MKKFILFTILAVTFQAYAGEVTGGGDVGNAEIQKIDIRDEAVLSSKMVKAILSGLSKEQGLKCNIITEEGGRKSIAYYTENYTSKFSAAFICNDGRSAIIKGIIGDGGQTSTEKFEMTYGG